MREKETHRRRSRKGNNSVETKYETRHNSSKLKTVVGRGRIGMQDFRTRNKNAFLAISGLTVIDRPTA